MSLITLLLLVGVFCNNSNIFSTAKFVREDPKSTTAAILTKPASRTYNCFLKNNVNCDLFKSNFSAGTIVGPPGFPENGPQNGRIASSGDPLYATLDEYSVGRWSPSHLKMEEYNETHFVSEMTWTINGEGSVIDVINVFLSSSNYTDDQPIRRSVLNSICSYGRGQRLHAKDTVRFDCYIEADFVKDLFYGSRGSGVLVSTLKIVGQNYAFYQVADVSLHEPIKTITNYHGFVSEPPSRARLCQLRANFNCGSIMYEPQSVEGFKGFPHGTYSPPDGKIASGNNPSFNKLNEYGANRWTHMDFPKVSYYNETHVYFNLSWHFTATHSSEDIRVFVSNENYKSTEPLSRRHLDLTPICSMKFHGKHPPWRLTMQCPIALEKYEKMLRYKELLLLSVWDIRDTANAFYQVVDLERIYRKYSVKNVSSKCRR